MAKDKELKQAIEIIIEQAEQFNADMQLVFYFIFFTLFLLLMALIVRRRRNKTSVSGSKRGNKTTVTIKYS